MRLRSPFPARGPAVVAATLLLAAGCGGGSTIDAACGDVVREELDPGWTVHLLPGAADPEYLTDPPTSGPHYGSEAVTGVVGAPLDGPAQVSVLELGGVLVQYRPDDLSTDDRGRLERLAEDGVVVAPAPGLPDPVMATAWVTKQGCDGVALDTLTSFIAEHGGRGPAPEDG